MTDSQALAAIAERTAKGWRFRFHTWGLVWECRAVGAGLASASAGGRSLGEAVGLALHFADAMEDDPQKVIEQHGVEIRRQAQRCFGDDADFRISVEESSYDFDAKRLHLIVRWPGSVEEFCRRDNEFLEWLVSPSTPRRILEVLMVMPEYPSEAPAGR